MLLIISFLCSLVVQAQEQFELIDITIENALKAYCSQTKSINNTFAAQCRTLFHLQPKQVKTCLRNVLVDLERQLGIQQDRQGHWKIGWVSGNTALATFAIIYAGLSSNCGSDLGYCFGSSAAALNALYFIGTYAYRKNNSSYIEKLNNTLMSVFSLKKQLILNPVIIDENV